MESQKLEFLEIGKKKIVAKKIELCEYCNYPSKDLIVCSGHKCFIRLCSGCRTYINNMPFCNDCCADVIRNKTFIVVTKENIGKPKPKGEIDEYY